MDVRTDAEKVRDEIAYPKKEERIKNTPVISYFYCDKCQDVHASLDDCPKISNSEAIAEMKRAHKAEEWARKVATDYCSRLNRAHGKIAILKHENNQLRKKISKQFRKEEK